MRNRRIARLFASRPQIHRQRLVRLVRKETRSSYVECLMNILRYDDIAGALSWLTSDAFESLEKPVLAVVLTPPQDRSLLRHLEQECRQIDRESDQILILLMGSGDHAVEVLNPLWRFERTNDLARRIKKGFKNVFEVYR